MKKLIGAFAAVFLLSASALLVSCSSESDSHEHTFAETYTSDATYHWFATTCGHDEVKDKAEHIFGDWIVYRRT